MLRVVVAVGLCAGCADQADLATLSSCIYAGFDQPTQVRLEAGEKSSVLGVYEPLLGGLCSGIVIADGVLLTARHCLSAERSSYDDLELLPGPDAYVASPIGRVTSAVFHPDVDAVTLRFEPSTSSAWQSTPVPLYRGVIDQSLVGTPVEIAGFGRSEATEGRLRFARQRVLAVDPVTITTATGAGACFGDSGGPMFVGTSSGTAVLGILGNGPTDCGGRDHYVRADLLRQLEDGCSP